MIYTLLRVTFCFIFRVFFRADIRGREHLPVEGPVILAANHMSNADPPLLATFLPRPVCYMAKQELFEVPVLKQIITAAHSFPVKRGAGDRGAIKAAMEVLKQGKVLGLFPEGTRSKDGKIHKAEAGVALIAAMTNAPVLPACIIGTDKIFANGGILPKVRVIYGEPMRFTGNRKEKAELEAFSAAIMAKIAEMKENALAKETIKPSGRS